MSTQTEPTTTLEHMTAWDIEILIALVDGPSMVVHGHERRVRAARLYNKLVRARANLVKKGAYKIAEPPGDQVSKTLKKGKK